MFEELITDVTLSKRAMSMYKISKDMEHASGYNFNASPGLANMSAHEVICVSYRLLGEQLLAASIAINEYGKSIDIKNELKFFSELSKAHNDAMESIQQDIAQKFDSWLSDNKK